MTAAKVIQEEWPELLRGRFLSNKAPSIQSVIYNAVSTAMCTTSAVNLVCRGMEDVGTSPAEVESVRRLRSLYRDDGFRLFVRFLKSAGWAKAVSSEIECFRPEASVYGELQETLQRYLGKNYVLQNPHAFLVALSSAYGAQFPEAHNTQGLFAYIQAHSANGYVINTLTAWDDGIAPDWGALVAQVEAEVGVEKLRKGFRVAGIMKGEEPPKENIAYGDFRSVLHAHLPHAVKAAHSKKTDEQLIEHLFQELCAIHGVPTPPPYAYGGTEVLERWAKSKLMGQLPVDLTREFAVVRRRPRDEQHWLLFFRALQNTVSRPVEQLFWTKEGVAEWKTAKPGVLIYEGASKPYRQHAHACTPPRQHFEVKTIDHGDQGNLWELLTEYMEGNDYKKVTSSEDTIVGQILHSLLILHGCNLLDVKASVQDPVVRYLLVHTLWERAPISVRQALQRLSGTPSKRDWRPFFEAVTNDTPWTFEELILGPLPPPDQRWVTTYVPPAKPFPTTFPAEMKEEPAMPTVTENTKNKVKSVLTETLDVVSTHAKHGFKVASADTTADLMLELAVTLFPELAFLAASENGKLILKFMTATAVVALVESEVIKPYDELEGLQKAAGLVIEATTRDGVQPFMEKATPILVKLAAEGRKFTLEATK